jgi:xanthine dehydrogenase accessory factor
VRGGGELASAAARLLFLAGFKVVVLEREQPLAVRRFVSFAEALAGGEHEVEGVRARRVEPAALPEALAQRGAVPVVVDPEGEQIAALRPHVVVDARMLKRAGARRSEEGPLLVGLGPGFVAGQDVDAVVETQRGADLGRVIWSGAALLDSGKPAPVSGVSDARVLRAPAAGRFVSCSRIGDQVVTLQRLGDVDGTPLFAGTAGVLRGLIADGVAVSPGDKLGDVDPRGRAVDPARISDKARAVAAGVLEAVTLGLQRRARSLLAGAWR